MSEIPREFAQIEMFEKHQVHPEKFENYDFVAGGRYSEVLRDFWRHFDPELVENFMKFYNAEKDPDQFVHKLDTYYTKDDSGIDVFVLARTAKIRRAYGRPPQISEMEVTDGWMYALPPVEREVYLAKAKEFLSPQRYELLLENVDKDLRKQ